ncbi:MAG TPA: hypothetical protein VES42_16035 [Pilimelia sp.]|nr:hypothetical protein [Pilimelia sp.]
MSFRRHAVKPTAALWSLVLLGDMALVVASAGVLMLVALASVATMGLAGVVAWRYAHRPADTVGPVPVRASARRGV